MQGKQAGSVTYLLGQFLHSSCDISLVFRLFQAFEEKWLSTTGGLQN